MKSIFTIFLLLVTLGLSAQSYNNEWIDYSKTYYKFKVRTSGLYRIPQSVLAGAGMGGTPVQNFQLFRNGQEVPIYTSVATGTLGNSDYIEFWGKMNDGAPDQALYRSPTYQHTQHWSLETDTAVYFLTVNNTGNTFHFANTTNDPTGTTLTPEPYFMYRAGNWFKYAINPGYAMVIGEYLYSSSYDIGEFWASQSIVPGGPLSSTSANLFVYPGGPNAVLNFGMAGCADNLRHIQVAVNNTQLIDTVMDSFNDVHSSRTVPLSLISGSNSATVQFSNSSTMSTDRTVASFYELEYPRKFDFGGAADFNFELPAKSDGYLLNITDLNISGGITPVLYDLTNGLRYNAIVSGGTLTFLLGGSTLSRKMVLVNEDPSTIKTITSLTERTFTNYTVSANQGNYIIISHPLLYTGSSGNNPVMDYKNYRSSAAGGSFDAQVYNIDDLVDEFAFGIKKDPLAIQNFLRYARAVFVAKPQYVLLIGHGMVYSDYNYYADSLHDPLADKLNIIPTFGSPASDNKLSANNGADAVPVTPIGRLSVVSGQEIEVYLAKIKTYEQTQVTAPNTIEGRLWMKNVLHLTGVAEPNLGDIICKDMYGYQAIITDSLFGANVATLCDGNPNQVSQVPTGLISGLFSNGLSMLNYFGHSSNTTLGYSLDDPKDYDNQGKYPVFYINGCDAGDFFVYDPNRFSSSLTLSENYVLTPDRGAIAFIASTHFGVVTYLDILLYNLYHLIDLTDYGKPIGISQKDALQALFNSAPNDFLTRMHAEEMTTHGDPYIKLNQAALPDYVIEPSLVQISPTFVSIADNTFKVNIHYYNLGKVVHDSISVLITRKYPDGSSTVLMKKRIPGIVYGDSMSLVVPIVATRDKGQNYITVTINSDNDVVEQTLANNTVTTSVYVYQDEANPVYPYNYGIINNKTQKLYASISNPFSPSMQYAMQIDTTTSFNSSMKVSLTQTSVGGVLEFDPHLSYLDSTVYYWRVAIVPTGDSAYRWNQASFVYLDSMTANWGGYNQSHVYQHLESSQDSIYMNPATRLWTPINMTNNIYVRNGIYPTASGNVDSYGVAYNNNQTIVGGCNGNELIINVFDSATFKPWVNDFTGPTGLYGSELATCGGGRQNNFDFLYSDSANRKKAMDFLNNVIPNGDYVVIRFNVNPGVADNVYIDQWKADTSRYGSGNSLYNTLFNTGMKDLDLFTKPRAISFVYQKGNINFIPASVISDSTTDLTNLSVNCTSPALNGTIVSPQFGPAKQWRQLHWRGKSMESPSTDNVLLNLYGIDTSGITTLLYNLGVNQQDYDISGIDAKRYPYLQLKLHMQDTINATPYQLRYWRLTDYPVPEGALAPNISVSAQDTLKLGEPLNFAIAFKNVSPTTFDSTMLVNLQVIDASNVTHTIVMPKRKVLASGDTLMVASQIDTKSYPGLNTLYLDVNPNNNQPEQYHFNNFLYKNFYVVGDNTNPTLDVTFDNVHILNDDIVSAKPHIQIKLKSLSDYVLLTDTSLIKLQLVYPDGSIHSYNFNNDTVRFTPASSSTNNTATVDFSPVFTQQYNPSGDNYQLIVSGKDELGHPAGATPYRIGFKIITKAMISNMLNYPNPFTTSTAFVFTITGSDVPQNIKIQILTITGKIVKEITKEELGPLHVGRNITEYKWNGTDMFGQRLANGVYLYHVVTNLNGKSLEKYQSAGDNTDQYFNNGYGKMYLMR